VSSDSSAQAGGAEFDVRRVAVIGAGVAGREFALRCARAGFAAVLEDVMPEKLRRAQDAYLEMSAGAGTLRIALTVEDAVKDADLAIDFVPDELESKLEIFSLLDRMAPPRTILCTPTMALSITDLASCTYRPERCVALRGMGTESVEVVQSRFAAADVVEEVVELLRKLGMQASVTADALEPMLMKNIQAI